MPRDTYKSKRERLIKIICQDENPFTDHSRDGIKMFLKCWEVFFDRSQTHIHTCGINMTNNFQFLKSYCIHDAESPRSWIEKCVTNKTVAFL